MTVTITEDRPAAGYEAARRAMIDGQLRTSGVNADAVLRRMAAVAREDFVPPAARGIAYMDRAISLGNGRMLAAPEVQGLMLQEAAPRAGEAALLVDGGSGYLAELLRPLVGSLEVLDPAGALAATRKSGDVSLIIVDGAAEQLPASLTRRLEDAGRIVTGLLSNGITRLAVGRKVGAEVSLLSLAEIGIPVLPEFTAPKPWSF